MTEPHPQEPPTSRGRVTVLAYVNWDAMALVVGAICLSIAFMAGSADD